MLLEDGEGGCGEDEGCGFEAARAMRGGQRSAGISKMVTVGGDTELMRNGSGSG